MGGTGGLSTWVRRAWTMMKLVFEGTCGEKRVVVGEWSWVPSLT